MINFDDNNRIILISRKYKGNTINKVKTHGLEYYTVNGNGMYWKLKYAKNDIDNGVTKLK